jgi:hypothetical protein
MDDRGDVVADEELVYRRVPLVHFVDGMVIYQAMMPHKSADPDGLSLTRAKLGSPEAMVANARRPGAGVFAATAGEIRALGLSVLPSPREDEPGHCHIPELNSSTRAAPTTQFLTGQLAVLFQKRPIILPQRMA